MITAQVTGPWLEETLRLFRELVGEPLKFREWRAQNAPYAVYFDQPAGGITGNTIYRIEQAQSSAEYFTELMIIFETTSGRGRYMLTTDRVGAATGIQIAAGGTFLKVIGHQNIRNFQMQAEAGQTLLFSRVLFR